MTDIPKCPKCNGEYTYFDGSIYVCPDCAHEFDSVEDTTETADVARDSNGAELFDGDAVTVIKDLKVKGSSMVIKRGTKVRSIRLTENPEEVDCKIDGSSIVLKTCFLKKSSSKERSSLIRHKDSGNHLQEDQVPERIPRHPCNKGLGYKTSS